MSKGVKENVRELWHGTRDSKPSLFYKGKRVLTSNIQIKACGAKVFTLRKTQITVSIILTSIETMSGECFSLW